MECEEYNESAYGDVCLYVYENSKSLHHSEGFMLHCSKEEDMDRKRRLRFINTVTVCDRPVFKVQAPNCDRRGFVLKEHFSVSSFLSHQFCHR